MGAGGLGEAGAGKGVAAPLTAVEPSAESLPIPAPMPRSRLECWHIPLPRLLNSPA